MLKKIKESKALKNSICSYLFFLSNTLFIFVSLPVVVSNLDGDQVGIWIIVNALIGYLLYFDIGLSYAISRVLAPGLVKKEQHEVDIWWSNAKAVLWTQFLVVIALGLTTSPLFLSVFNIQEPYREDGAFLYTALMCVGALGIPLRCVPGLLNAQERFHWVPLVGAFAPWLQVSVLVFCLSKGMGLKAFPIGALIAQIFTWVAYTFLVRKGSMVPHAYRKLVSLSRLTKLFRFSGGLMVIGFVEVVLRNLPSLILGRIGGLASVPRFNFTAKGPLLSGDLVLRSFQAFQPGWQGSYVSGDHSSFKRKFNVAGTIALGVATIGSAGTIAFNPIFLQIILDQSFFAGPVINIWVATSVITIPMAMYFHSLITLSGKVGLAPFVAVGKLIISAVGGLVGWHFFGLSGLAAVFAFVPFINGTYGYLAGSKACGFKTWEVSPTLPAMTIACIVLVVVVGLISVHLFEPWATFWILGKIVQVPCLIYFLPSICLGLLGVFLVWLGIMRRRD